jgi:ribonuclease HI
MGSFKDEDWGERTREKRKKKSLWRALDRCLKSHCELDQGRRGVEATGPID